MKGFGIVLVILSPFILIAAIPLIFLAIELAPLLIVIFLIAGAGSLVKQSNW